MALVPSNRVADALTNVLPTVGRYVTLASLIALAAIAGSSAPAAESGASLRIGHYSTGNGLAGFVLNRLGTPVKLRLDGSEEIWALSPEPATHDAADLKRDDHTNVLRIYDHGQVLLFDRRFPNGAAEAYRDQPAEPLAIAGATKAQAEARARAVSQKLKRTGGLTLELALDAPRIGDGSAGWSAMADAAAIAGIAIEELAAAPVARDTIAEKLRRVVIRDAGRIDIRVADRTLIIEIAADKPIVGRPSSAQLKSTIGDLL